MKKTFHGRALLELKIEIGMKKNKMKRMNIEDGVKNEGFSLIPLFILMHKVEIKTMVVLDFSNHFLSR